MIDWTLEVNDVEDVACPADDMKGHGLMKMFRSEGRDWGKGKGEQRVQGVRGEAGDLACAISANCHWASRLVEASRPHYSVQTMSGHFHEENTTETYCTIVGLIAGLHEGSFYKSFGVDRVYIQYQLAYQSPSVQSVYSEGDGKRGKRGRTRSARIFSVPFRLKALPKILRWTSQKAREEKG